MNKRFSIIALLLVLLNSCNSKTADKTTTANNDSIQKYIGLAGNDTLDFEKRIKYNNKALSFIDLEKNDSLTMRNLYEVSLKYYFFNKKEDLKSCSNALLRISTEEKDSIALGYAHKSIGLYNMLNSNNEKSIEHLILAKKIFESQKNDEFATKVMLDILITQYYACDYLGSNKTAFEILKKNEIKKEKEINYCCYNIIANNLSGLNQHSKAIEYYLKAVLNCTKIRYKYISFNNIAQEYIALGKHKEANKYLKIIISSQLNKKKFPNEYAIAESLFALSEIESKKNTKVLKLLKDADSIFSTRNSLNGYNYNLINFSKLYFIKSDTIQAIFYAKKAVTVSESYKNPNDILMSLSQLIKVDKKNASENALKYIRVNDSLHLEERKFRDKYAQIQFETNEIKTEKDAVIKQRSFFIAIALSTFLLAVLIIIITRQRLKQKELRLKQTQQKANEELYQLLLDQKDSEEKARYLEKKRIAMELHDGVMNKLTSTRLNLSVLSIKKDQATIEKCLGYIKDINLVENEIRNITHNLNQEVFHSSNSFVKLLEDFVEEQNGISNTHFLLEIDSAIDWNVISNVTKMNLYRIIQETVHNINKHSKAQKGIINLIIDQGNICLSVIDDGIGIDFSETGQGIGLKNIEHRVNQLRGKLHIHSKSNSGTSINISLPLEKAD